MHQNATPGLSIATVSRRTGIPITTLRFYEKELPGLFLIRKTRGGHRRYRDQDVERFTAVRQLTEMQGLKLSEVRRVMASRGDQEPMREEVEQLRERQREEAQSLEELFGRLARLEELVRLLEAGHSRRRGWFKRN